MAFMYNAKDYPFEIFSSARMRYGVERWLAAFGPILERRFDRLHINIVKLIKHAESYENGSQTLRLTNSNWIFDMELLKLSFSRKNYAW